MKEKILVKSKKKDKLWYGLPAIFYRGKYLVFSPFKREVVPLSSKKLDDPRIAEDFFKKGYIKDPHRPTYAPTNLFLTVTENCNMACTYCYGCYGEGKGMMTKETALTILRERLKEDHSPSKKVWIHFFGGEPTLNFPVIEAVVNYLKKRKIKARFTISTNGVVSDKILDFLIKNKFIFRLSLDGLPGVQNHQRPLKGGGPSSPHVKDTIKRLVKARAWFAVKMVVTEKGIDKIVESASYLADLGVKHLQIEPARIHGRAKRSGHKEVKTKEFVKRFFEAVKAVREKGCRISSIAFAYLYNPTDCFCGMVGSNRILVNWDGKLAKCVENVDNPESYFQIGTVKDKNVSLNQKRFNQIRNLSVNSMPKCQDCFAKYICGGGCFHRNNQLTGNFLTPHDDDCELKREMLRRLIVYLYENR